GASSITFSQLDELTAHYAFDLGDCHGGSLRWTVRVDSNTNGVLDSNDKPIYIYYGLPASFGNDPDGPGPLPREGGCTSTSNAGASQSDVNLLSPTEQAVTRF